MNKLENGTKNYSKEAMKMIDKESMNEEKFKKQEDQFS